MNLSILRNDQARVAGLLIGRDSRALRAAAIRRERAWLRRVAIGADCAIHEKHCMQCGAVNAARQVYCWACSGSDLLSSFPEDV